MHRPRRHLSWNYPLWVGLIAAVSALAFWSQLQPKPGIANKKNLDHPLAQIDNSGDRKLQLKPQLQQGNDDIPQLVFDVIGGGPVNVEALQNCLTKSKSPRAEVRAEGKNRMFIERSDLRYPIQLKASEGRWTLETRARSQPHLASAIHLGITGCLYQDGAMVLDRVLGRRFMASEWPRLTETGGLPVTKLVAITTSDGFLQTHGLERLGRSELRLELGSIDERIARERIEQAAAAAVVNNKDKRLFIGPGGAQIRLVKPSTGSEMLNVIWQELKELKRLTSNVDKGAGKKKNPLTRPRLENAGEKLKAPIKNRAPRMRKTFRPDYR